MIDLRCHRVKIHGLPLHGWFSTDWQSVARATKLRTVDQGCPVIRLIAAQEYLKYKRTMIALCSARVISRHAVRGIVGGVANFRSHNPIFLMGCTWTESPRLLHSDCTMPLTLATGRIVYYTRPTSVRLRLLCVANVGTCIYHQNDTYVTLFAVVAVMQ